MRRRVVGAVRGFPLITIIVTIAILVVATFFEASSGSSSAYSMVYGTWWFRLLWGVLAAVSVVWCVRQRLWRRPVVMLLHASFIVILIGALTTALCSTRGQLQIWEGEQTTMFLTDDQPAQKGRGHRVAHMDFALRLDSFRVDRYADTGEPSGYRSHVTVIDRDGTQTAHVICMNHILRHHRLRYYQAGYTPDGHGTILSVVHDPYGIGITYAGYAMLFLSCILLLVGRLPKRALLGLGVAAFVALLYALQWTTDAHLLPVLRSPLLGIHVGVIITAYVLFLILTFAPFFPKRKEWTHAIDRMHQVAVLLLVVGIFLGAVWANISWGMYWSWDPKEVWALITMFVYCLPLHRRSLPWFADERHRRLYLSAAFLCVLITYFGVNFFLGGMHSYAG